MAGLLVGLALALAASAASADEGPPDAAYRARGLAAYAKQDRVRLTHQRDKGSNMGDDAAEVARMREALAWFRRAVDADPTNAENHAYVGNAHFRLDEFGEAKAAHETAASLDPAAARYRSNLGSLFAQRGRYAEALAYFQAAKALDPSDGTLAKNYDSAEMFLRFEQMVEELEGRGDGAHWDVAGFVDGRNYSEKVEVTFNHVLGNTLVAHHQALHPVKARPGSKVDLLRAYLADPDRNIRDGDLLLFLDAYDVLLLPPARDLPAKFAALEDKLQAAVRRDPGPVVRRLGSPPRPPGSPPPTAPPVPVAMTRDGHDGDRAALHEAMSASGRSVKTAAAEKRRIDMLRRHEREPSGSTSEVALFAWLNSHVGVIHPLGAFRIRWDVVTSVVLFACLLVTPYQLCFIRADLRPMDRMELLNLAFDVVFLADFFLNFNTGYVDDHGTVVKDHRRIVKQYGLGRGRFGHDAGWSKSTWVADYFNGGEARRHGEDEPAVDDHHDDHGHRHYYRAFPAPMELYCVAMYWAFTTLTTVGYGARCRSRAEMAVTVVVQFAGTCILGYVMGDVASMLTKEEASSRMIRTASSPSTRT
ncbi:hypothetical protein JL722_11452 [Aureococcus anophagefferens]|nr:hypothetical protein JL722_11452 [Aureococcus anophagefferens]